MSRLKLAHKLYQASKWCRDNAQLSDLLAEASTAIRELVQEKVILKDKLEKYSKLEVHNGQTI
jgi:hypothetical protein